MRAAVADLVAAIGHPPPPALASVVATLEASAWPEIAGTWSRLTPTGFPVELSVTADPATVRWTAEIAGPEVPEAARLELVAGHLERRGQPVGPTLLGAVSAVQAGRDLRFGAWIGGRSAADGTCRHKLYAELPGAETGELPLPEALAELLPRVPPGARPRLLGLEPSRDRVEIYLRLPQVLPDALGPVFAAAGMDRAMAVLDVALPDGRERLRGRRLGLSLAASTGEPGVEVTVVATARTLFPGSPELVDALVPGLGAVPSAFRRTTVSLALAPGRAGVACAVGLTTRAAPASARRLAARLHGVGPAPLVV